jgi:ABC-type sugar transport system ATPase subunit
VTDKGGWPDGHPPTASNRQPLLQLRGISKRFGAVQALSEVDFEVYPGEVVALVGDNGAGKSTLIKVMAGIYIPDSGEIWFEGHHVPVHGPRDSAALGIATVYQDLALSDNLDVVANLYLGREELSTPLPLLSEERMEQRAREVLKSLDVKIPNPRSPVAALSGGQRQSVAVARSVMWKAKVVMLDEPTAALGVAQTMMVLELTKRLKDHGLAVMVISHNLNDVFAVADRIAVLHLGRMVAQDSVSAFDRQSVVDYMTVGASSREVQARDADARSAGT